MAKLISIEPTTDNSTTYFALDGNYGEAQGMVVIDTTKWSEDDWTQIDEASDSERAQVALVGSAYKLEKGKQNGKQSSSRISE